MPEFLLIPIAIIYFTVSTMLFMVGANFIYLSFRTWRTNRTKPDAVKMWETAERPYITVQLPIFNELYVAERIIDAAAQLDYPTDKLQIQVLDDSTDETVDIARRTVNKHQQQGINIVHLHRTDRSGFKAGALQAGMASATGDYIAIFDADFVPQPEFLQQAMPYFDAPKIAFVQTRWGHLNPGYSWLTFLQSLAIDGHFMVEQFARSQAGYWFNFNGTAGIWRRTAMEDAGGWTADTLTEDLDLSYRAYLKGWYGRYVRDIVVPAEVPPSFNAYRKQQHRWARGSLECARKLAPQVWRAPIPFSHKFQATLHLFGYSVHLLLFVLMLIYPFVALFTAQHEQLSTLYGFAYLFALTSIAPTLFFVIGQQQQERSWLKLLPKILAISVVGSGLMINTVRAAWHIWHKPNGVFERTAKFGIGKQQQDWTSQRYQLRFDPIVYVELILGSFSLITAWIAITLASWGIVLYALLFGTGLILAATVTVFETTAVSLNRKKRAQQAQRELEWAKGGSGSQ
ncbi:MAG: glycosyltransferase [Chloroflexi bacterium]|nr:glycosyltransferase [Chloroflexota bacterium]